MDEGPDEMLSDHKASRLNSSKEKGGRRNGNSYAEEFEGKDRSECPVGKKRESTKFFKR